MNINHFISIAATAAAMLLLASCNSGESYSDRLNTERNSCNAYLSNFRVVNDIPADTVFETGKDAPFYRINPDGQVYMQVIHAGDRVNDRARNGEAIYFRFTRSDLNHWHSTGLLDAYQSNEDDLSATPTYFNYKNFTLPTSSQWGYGIQLPLEFIGVEGSEVNLVIKSNFGFTSEISYVMPYLFHVRYFHSRI
ncbi:MAG: DUF4827 family protein [Muribaculaceae bacterium]|nr:DUF4827 family protein [Muribaculaceae bacterium]